MGKKSRRHTRNIIRMTEISTVQFCCYEMKTHTMTHLQGLSENFIITYKNSFLWLNLVILFWL